MMAAETDTSAWADAAVISATSQDHQVCIRETDSTCVALGVNTAVCCWMLTTAAEWRANAYSQPAIGWLQCVFDVQRGPAVTEHEYSKQAVADLYDECAAQFNENNKRASTGALLHIVSPLLLAFEADGVVACRHCGLQHQVSGAPAILMRMLCIRMRPCLCKSARHDTVVCQ